MNSMRGIIQVGQRRWKGARLIRIDALPASLPSGLQSDILIRCQHEQASLELCMTTAGGDAGEVALLLIIRAVSDYPYETLDRLERVAGMLSQLLADAGVRCHAVGDGAEEARWLERFFSGDLAPVSSAMGFFPPEGAPNPGKIYLPGQYGARDVAPVDLGRLVTLLSGYPNALVSLQMNVAHLLPQELDVVRRNREWFARLAASHPMASQGKEAFARLERAAGSPLFMTCFFCVGGETCVRDVAALALGCGLRAFRLPGSAPQSGYALRGNERIAAVFSASGHEPHCPPAMLRRMGRLTHLAPLGSLCAAFSLPRYMGEVRGVRINRVPVSREPLPAALGRPGGIYLGRRFEGGQPVSVKPDDLTRHGFFVGKPGSGKTTFALGLLHRLYSHPNHYPFLAFEPAKTEYRSLLECIPELRVYTPGREDVAPIQLNPFLPPRGVRLEQYQQNLEAIFAMAVSVDHPLDVIFPQVISRCYARYGWRPSSTRDSEGVRVFGMHEFIREFRQYIREHFSGDPVSESNLENGGVVRLSALINMPLFDTNQSLDVDELLKHPTVIELDALNNPSHKALVMGILLTQIMLTVQQRGGSQGKLRNAILVDEAHLLLSQSGGGPGEGPQPARAVVEQLQNMTLILRAYGTALLFGDQSPARLTSVITDNVDLKMMFRLDSRQDRAILAETALMDDAMTASMAALPSGEGYFHCGALAAPIHIVTPNTEQALHLNKALPDERVRQHADIRLAPPFFQCAACSSCGDRCDPAVRADARFVASRLLDSPEVAEMLADPDRQAGLARFLGEPMARAAADILRRFHMPGDDPRMMGCVRAQLIRALLLSPQCVVSEEALMDPDAARDGDAGINYDNILDVCAVKAAPEAQPGSDDALAGEDAEPV